MILKQNYPNVTNGNKIDNCDGDIYNARIIAIDNLSQGNYEENFFHLHRR
ncbi:MAG: hypothetical protein ACK47N_09620 [Microcystis sp.]|nr:MULTISPECIES: hypothetical protein [Microcystis]NCQ90710.1 hypothetical protein [Microcystis aeruginosa LG13-13]NCR04060.1 hypothetical protein [Microcystis aeruginosa LG13-03]NCR64022.1 hypothetical protein [Microcystis aeruginosa LG11-05]MBD2289601.1 hypothetical protein [Microcystis wesenbergii FACHB-1317]UZO77856.1 hypothetical protein M8120_08090 [Microcystis aeruginosa str. Chao 1910]